MQCLTQWCPANAQLSGNMDFTKLAAWREGSVEDGVTHSAQGALGRCGLLKAFDRHPVSQHIVYCRLSPNQDTPAIKETGLALGHRLRRGRRSGGRTGVGTAMRSRLLRRDGGLSPWRPRGGGGTSA